ncbi:MAG: DMT family transporter [Granulosicoccaceae bacterium]
MQPNDIGNTSAVIANSAPVSRQHRKSVVMGSLAMLASTLFFASMHACVRYLSGDLHPFEIAFFRNLLGVLILIPFAIKAGTSVLKTQHFNLHLIRASFNVVAMLVFFYALSITPLALVQALSFTAPLFTTILAVFFLGEIVRLRRWAAIIVGFIGVLIILRPGVEPIQLGAVLVMCSAAIWAMTMIVIKKLSNTDSALTITLYVSLFLTLFSFLPALIFWEWPEGVQWLWLLAIALLGTSGQLCLAKAFSYADATLVLPIDFAKIIWGALFGYWFFAEAVDSLTWLGAIIVFGGACYLAWRERQLEKDSRLQTQSIAATVKSPD